MKMDKKKFTIYMIFAFGLAWVIQIIASIFSRNGNVAVFRLLLSVCMFMPFLATFIAKIPFLMYNVIVLWVKIYLQRLREHFKPFFR